MVHLRSAEELRQLIESVPQPKPCRCALGACSGWESLSESRWPTESVKPAATLRDPEISEPTYEERHLDLTRYESPNAPIAIKFFPYNRCDVWFCNQCQRHLMRYTEFGGYYVDHRVREISSEMNIID